MNFECLLLSAKAGNEDAITAILQMYRPLLLKYAIIDSLASDRKTFALHGITTLNSKSHT